MTDYQMELIDQVLKILEKRATDESRPIEMRMAYDSALIMLIYALKEDGAAVAQVDY